jgi:hypothetical protein
MKYNICDVPPESTVSRRKATNLPHYIIDTHGLLDISLGRGRGKL